MLGFVIIGGGSTKPTTPSPWPPLSASTPPLVSGEVLLTYLTWILLIASRMSINLKSKSLAIVLRLLSIFSSVAFIFFSSDPIEPSSDAILSDDIILHPPLADD